MIFSLKEYKSVVARLGVSLLLFTFLYSTMYGVATEIGALVIEAFPKSDTAYIIVDLIRSLAYLLSYTLPVPIFYLISKNSDRHPIDLSLKLPSHRPALTYTAIILSGTAAVIAMGAVNSLVFPVYSVAEPQPPTYFDYSKSYLFALGFISSAIVPPFAEELLFRGLIISNLKPYNKSAAVVVSAVAFGIMHQNPRQLLYATAAGLVLGVVYLLTDSIWCCIAIHFANNFFTLLNEYVNKMFGEDVSFIFGSFFNYFLIIIGTGCALYLLKALKDNSEPKEKNQSSLFGYYKVSGRARCRDLKYGYITQAFLTLPFFFFIGLCAYETLKSALPYLMLW